jgi:hypothetical protein
MVGKIVVRVRPAAARLRMPIFVRPLILLVAVMALAASFGAGAAHASKCSDALIQDWYGDGRVDNTYAVHCYREALKDIPEDQLVYGTLRDDLNRALQSAIRNNNGNPLDPDFPILGADPGGGNSGGGGGGDGFFQWLAKAVGPDTADSIPIPLLILAGLALALMAAAGVSFFARRLQAKRAAAEPPPTGPIG